MSKEARASNDKPNGLILASLLHAPHTSAFYNVIQVGAGLSVINEEHFSQDGC